MVSADAIGRPAAPGGVLMTVSLDGIARPAAPAGGPTMVRSAGLGGAGLFPGVKITVASDCTWRGREWRRRPRSTLQSQAHALERLAEGRGVLIALVRRPAQRAGDDPIDLRIEARHERREGRRLSRQPVPSNLARVAP